MASGPTVDGGDGGTEKKRFIETKVYRRKSFKGQKKDAIIVQAPEKTVSLAADDSVVSAAPASIPVEVEAVLSEPDRNLSSSAAEKEKDVTLLSQEGVSEDVSRLERKEDAEAEPPLPVPDTAPASRADVAGSNDSPTLNQKKAAETEAEVEVEVEVGVEVDPALGQASASTSRIETVVLSEDSSSLNRPEGVAVVAPGPSSGNGQVDQGSDHPVDADPDSQARQEARELRRKLRGQLDTVRTLVRKIEAKQVQIGGFPSRLGAVSNGGTKRAHSEMTSFGSSREISRPLNQLSIAVLENSLGVGGGVGEIIEKEKRTPKANQFYRNSEFLLAKDKIPPAESNKKSKSNGKRHGGDHGIGMGTKFLKSCSSLLEKLMKHKHGWVFNEPVDAERLGLHDYHIIIKQPMDLGTVKSRLSTNWYKYPKEFAEDVRLAFRNAMTYNPKGQDVHVMAEQLSTIFEERWAIIESDYNREMRYGMEYGAGYPTPTSRKAPPPLLPPPPLDMRRILDRSESMTYSADPKRRPITHTPTARTPALKKPKAKDLYKRDMTYDEKQKLSTHLQGLPSEKLDAIVQIIKKRNSSLFQQDDEIEVDIDSVDAETLWELDRFVTNYKKSLSKNKRKAELAKQARAQALQTVQEQQTQPQTVQQEGPGENKTGENIVSASSPVQGDNQGNNRSRSSSSSSSSSSGSSSSDSDSDSSSGSGSDDESPART